MIYLGCLLAVVVLGALLIWAYIQHKGDAVFYAEAEKEPSFEILSRDEKNVVLATTFPLKNIGKQGGTIMDCILRPLLPYEQYDCIEVRGKMEQADRPREDDYFEAVIVPRGQQIELKAVLRLTARKGLSLEKALQKMVDVPMDVIYTAVSRHPWRMVKVRLVLTAEEIARVMGTAQQAE